MSHSTVYRSTGKHDARMAPPPSSTPLHFSLPRVPPKEYIDSDNRTYFIVASARKRTIADLLRAMFSP